MSDRMMEATTRALREAEDRVSRLERQNAFLFASLVFATIVVWVLVIWG